MIGIGRIKIGLNAVTQPGADAVSTGNGAKANTANIILQNNPLSDGYWVNRSPQELGLTLIHELGHVYNIVVGLGGSAIEWDSNPDDSINWDAEDRNDKLLEKCR